MEHDVQQWLDDATKKLSSARALGAKANTLLNATKSTISANNAKLIKSNFLLDSVNQLVQILETVSESLELRLQDRRQSVNVLENYLNLSLSELRKEFDKLKQIKIDKGLLSESHDTLYDFISTEVLDTLVFEKSRLQKTRTTYVDTIEHQKEVLMTKLDEFNRIFNQLENEVTEVSESQWISDLIEENNKLEEEVATLLESLTKHYDQCVRGSRIFEGKEPGITEEEKQELLDVLSKDFQEVPDVLEDLEESIDDIEQRCKKIESYLTTKFYDIKLKHLVQDLTSFGGNDLVSIISAISRQTVDFRSVSRDINEKCDEAHQLIKHYQQFVDSYYSLVLELQRRKNVQKTMVKVFEDAKNKLEALQADNFEKRDMFLHNNGPSLPSNLWAGLNDDSPLGNIRFEIHDLPELSVSTIAAAKKHNGE